MCGNTPYAAPENKECDGLRTLANQCLSKMNSKLIFGPSDLERIQRCPFRAIGGLSGVTQGLDFVFTLDCAELRQQVGGVFNFGIRHASTEFVKEMSGYAFQINPEPCRRERADRRPSAQGRLS